jgi:hypothetical protein
MDSPSEPTTLRDSSAPAAAAQAAATPNPAPASGERQPDTAVLLEQLRQDRLWLLRQLDSGRWPQWRLDLAALERELGHLLDQAAEGLPRS